MLIKNKHFIRAKREPRQRTRNGISTQDKQKKLKRGYLKLLRTMIIVAVLFNHAKNNLRTTKILTMILENN